MDLSGTAPQKEEGFFQRQRIKEQEIIKSAEKDFTRHDAEALGWKRAAELSLPVLEELYPR